MANLVAMESHLNKTKLDYTCKCFLGCITEQNLLHKNCCCILAVYYRFTLAAFNMQTQVKERASFKLSVHMHAKGLKWQIINIQFKFPFWRTIQQMWPTLKKSFSLGESKYWNVSNIHQILHFQYSHLIWEWGIQNFHIFEVVQIFQKIECAVHSSCQKWPIFLSLRKV